MLMKAPQSHGFDAARLARIDGFLKDRYLDSGKLANVQLLVARDGEIVHFSSQGAARDGGSKAIDEGSLFRIASMTKPITSIAFMMLVEEGLVAVDTPVHHVLPEFKGIGVFEAGGGAGAVPDQADRAADADGRSAPPYLGADLWLSVSHQRRCGVSRRQDGQLARRARSRPFVGALAQIPLEFSPGEAWNYSVSTDVLGAVVQRVSGMPLDQFFRDRIFAPLKMDDTFFDVPADKIDRLTDCYTFVAGKGRIMYDRADESAWARKPKFLSGGGGLVSTALDYNRFCQMCLNGGELDGVRLVGRKTIELMTINHLPGEFGPGDDVALAVQRSVAGRHRVRAGLRGQHGPRAGHGAGIGRRILLGRDVLDRVLHRSGRAAQHGVHDADEPVEHLTRSAAN